MIKKTLLTWIIMVILFSLLNIGVKFIDNATLQKNALISEIILEKEGDYPRPWINYALFQKDNFTDAIMVSTSAYRTHHNVMDDAFANPFYYRNEVDTTNSKAAISGIEGKNDEIFYYGRYWHGYNSILIPTLAFFNLSTIRIINAILLYCLALISALLIWRKIGLCVAVAYVMSLVCVAFPIVPLSLQFSTCFYIMFSAVIIILLAPRKRLQIHSCQLAFFIVGGITVYFDFLTTPLLTLGIPAAILILCRNNLPDTKLLMSIIIFWSLGYAGIWTSKWILASLFTNHNIFESALLSANLRSESIFSQSTPMKSTHRLLIYCLIPLLISAIIYGVILLKKYHKTHQIPKNIPFLIISLLPIIWIIVLQNHSFYHFWYVWRIMMVFFFNVFIYIYLSIKYKL